MILIALKTNGDAEIVAPFRVYQGSDGNDVVVISPFPNTCPLQIAATFPDKTNTGYLAMESVPLPGELADLGVSAWRFRPPTSWTTQFGDMYINMCVQSDAEEVPTFDENRQLVYRTVYTNTTTYMCRITVSQSTVPSIDDLSSDELTKYEQLLRVMASYASQLHDVQDELLAADDEPTEGSSDLVRSGGTYTAIRNAEADAMEYAEDKAQDAENNANSYTDDKASDTLSSAESYADTKASAAETAAKNYTDQKIAAIHIGSGDTTVYDTSNQPITALHTDSTPTANSQNVVTSGGIKTYVDNAKQEAKGYTDQQVSLIPKFDIEVVESLPTEDISETTVYLVPSTDEATNNVYTEYIYVDGAWEKLGTQDLDLSNYVSDSELESTLAEYVTNTSLESTLSDYVTETSLGTTLEDYVTGSSLESTLSDYVTETALGTTLSDYATSSDLSTGLSGKQDTLTFDSAPTQNSTNPATSGGIYTAIGSAETSAKSYADGVASTAESNAKSYADTQDATTLSSAKSYTDTQVSLIPKFAIQVVNQLPVSDISTTTVYLVPSTDTATSNIYTEWIYVNNTWEKLGTQDLDLSDYVTDTELSTELADYVTDTSLQSTLSDYVTDTELGTTLADYVTDTSLGTTLADYVTDTSLQSTLSDYVTDTSLQSTLSDYVTDTSLGTTLADYVTDTDLSTDLLTKQDTLTFDNTPTANSSNPVTSGGIKSYVDDAESSAKSYADSLVQQVGGGTQVYVDNTFEATLSFDSDPQTQISGKQATITGAATTITSADLTASRAVISDANGKIDVSATTSTELGYLSGVTSAVQTQINGKQDTITGAASSVVSSNLTASKALVSDANGKIGESSVSSTELGCLSGVTSSVQTQINGKQSTITGAATTITGSDLSANKALVSNASGKVDVSAVTSTELGYVSGVTSAIQTQINDKLGTSGDGSNTTVAFTEASTRANVATGESQATLWGKASKYFSDLQTVAFTGAYGDLSGTPTIPTVNNGTLTINKDNTVEATFTANQSGNTTVNLAKVAFTGEYSDLSSKPVIPTVNDGTLTINQNGTQLGTFTANQSGNTIVDITNANPNLLINSNFAINQRGASSYTAPGSGVKYGVDRFYQSAVSSGNILVSTQNYETSYDKGGVNLLKNGSSVAGFYMLSQRLENYTQLAGLTLTLSAKYRNNTGSFRLQANDGVSSYNSSSISSASGIATLTFTMNASPTNLRVTIQDQQAANFSVDIDWMKLEIGSIATSYTPPIIAEELIKCQRYYQKILTSNGYGVFCAATANSSTSCLFNLPIGTSMRIAPTISKSGDIGYFQYNNGTQTICLISAISSAALLDNGVYCTATISGATSATMGMIRAYNSANAYIELDAEIS